MPRIGLYIDSDMSGGFYAVEFMSTFVKQMNTQAHKRQVIKSTHNAFASMFDERIGVEARFRPAEYHHVYEYARGGDPYRDIGKRSARLWRHHLRHVAGETAHASWNWRAAQQYNPTYLQRRTATVGWDAIRHIPEEEFQKLLLHSSGRRHKFRWKAPMLEHGLRANVDAKDRFLALPTFTAGGGAEMRFRPFVTSYQQQPGKVAGNFTAFWVRFWGTEVPKKFDEVIGDVIERDAAIRIKNALARGGKARTRNQKIGFTGVTNEAVARAAGKEQAIASFKAHSASIAKVEKARRDLFE